MGTTYTTIDGMVFDNKDAAEAHDRFIAENIIMVDYFGDLTINTVAAYGIYINNPEAAKVLMQIAKVQEDSFLSGIDEESRGMYVWDEYAHHYVPVDIGMGEIIHHLYKLIKEK